MPGPPVLRGSAAAPEQPSIGAPRLTARWRRTCAVAGAGVRLQLPWCRWHGPCTMCSSICRLWPALHLRQRCALCSPDRSSCRLRSCWAPTRRRLPHHAEHFGLRFHPRLRAAPCRRSPVTGIGRRTSSCAMLQLAQRAQGRACSARPQRPRGISAPPHRARTVGAVWVVCPSTATASAVASSVR